MNATSAETTAEVAPPATQNRWRPSTHSNLVRPYSQEAIKRLRGTVKIEYTLALLGAERLWKLLQEEEGPVETKRR